MTLPAEMWGPGSTVTAVESVGMCTPGGEPVPITREHARSGFEPVMVAACGAAGMSSEDANLGAALLRMTAGAHHEETASVGKNLQNSGLGAAVERLHIEMPHTGMAPGKSGPDGQGLG